ncbi:MAG: CRISPR-associated endonuclease Cas2 [Candidatus Zambryskibacteria bacterium]|nr:CRISPR-associated endonuclease Cas2 [Candidatus Zambryskibacteria bacterium]
MGKLEEENRKVIRRTRIQEAILLTVASGGRLGAELITNRVMESLLGISSDSPPRRNEVIRSTASRLARNGLLKFEEGHYLMTKQGEKVLDRWRRADFKLARPKKWDKKWRIIIFDIPESKKRIRNEVREIFKAAGFQRLQDSVWVYPYDCEDVIGLLKVDYGIGRDLLYIIADQIENDKYLRMDFDLIK